MTSSSPTSVTGQTEYQESESSDTARTSRGGTSLRLVSHRVLYSPSLGEFAQNKVIGVFRLTNQSWNDLPIRIRQARVRARQIRLQTLLQPGEGVKRHGGKHVVLNVIVHAEVKKSQDRIQFDGASIEPVVADIFCQASVLRQRKNLMQPAAVEPCQWEEQDRQPASGPNGPDNHSDIDGEVDPRPPEHLPPLAVRYKLFRL